MVNSFHIDIAGNVQTDFFYVFYFILVYFTKPAISKIYLRVIGLFMGK
jgi:hypothetical protein